VGEEKKGVWVRKKEEGKVEQEEPRGCIRTGQDWGTWEETKLGEGGGGVFK
jgi:hypothetical protein